MRSDRVRHLLSLIAYLMPLAGAIYCLITDRPWWALVGVVVCAVNGLLWLRRHTAITIKPAALKRDRKPIVIPKAKERGGG